jgi:hypothetical protein
VQHIIRHDTSCRAEMSIPAALQPEVFDHLRLKHRCDSSRPSTPCLVTRQCAVSLQVVVCCSAESLTGTKVEAETRRLLGCRGPSAVEETAEHNTTTCRNTMHKACASSGSGGACPRTARKCLSLMTLHVSPACLAQAASQLGML